MRFLKLSLALFACAGGFALANEAPPAEGGGAAPMPKGQREFVEKNAKLNSLTNKIAESGKQFAELVHHKNEAKTAAAKQEIIREMVTLTNQRNKDVDQYNKLKSELELRYPNQGEYLNRRYQTQTKRSVEEMEGAAGLDDLLTRTKKVVQKKFAPLMPDEPETESKSKAAHAPGTADEPKRLRLEK